MSDRLTGRGTAWIRLLAIVPLLAAGIALGAPSPTAAATVCNTGEAYQVGGTIKDSIVVEEGTFCWLHNVTIRGSVTVEADARFIAIGAEIRGSVSGTAVRYIDVEQSVVRGDVTVAGSTNAQVYIAEVRGKVELTGATGYAKVAFATVRGSVTLDNNNVLYVLGNTIDTDLTCSSNGTTTNIQSNTVYPNTVGGAKLGDCAGL